ncbi:MAG: OmpA family protein [Paracoccaceae bacterium]
MTQTQTAAARRRAFPKTALTLGAASLIALTACTDPSMMNPDDPQRNTKQGTLLGSLVGAAAGAMVSDNKAKGAVIGGLVGAGAGAAIGNNLDKQEAALRRDLGNDNVTIRNTGDRLIVTLPQDILFATDSASLRPDLQSDLRTVAANLNDYPNTTVQVLGHTDNTGGASYNLDLSARRASTVANVLIASGVAPSRVVTTGRGEDQPIASNLTPEGRAQNRRVEIVILPSA